MTHNNHGIVNLPHHRPFPGCWPHKLPVSPLTSHLHHISIMTYLICLCSDYNKTLILWINLEFSDGLTLMYQTKYHITTMWVVTPQIWMGQSTVLLPHWSATQHKNTRVLSQHKDCLSRYGIPMLKIRRSQDRLIFNMGIPIYLYWDAPHGPVSILRSSFQVKEFPL